LAINIMSAYSLLFIVDGDRLGLQETMPFTLPAKSLQERFANTPFSRQAGQRPRDMPTSPAGCVKHVSPYSPRRHRDGGHLVPYDRANCRHLPRAAAVMANKEAVGRTESRFGAGSHAGSASNCTCGKLINCRQAWPARCYCLAPIQLCWTVPAPEYAPHRGRH